MFFLELSCFFDDPVDVDSLISGSSAFSKMLLGLKRLDYRITILCQKTWVQFQNILLTVYVILGRSFRLSDPQYLFNGKMKKTVFYED